MQAITVDNTDSRIQYIGEWTQGNAFGYPAGAVVHSTVSYGASFTFTFNGTGIVVVGGVPVNTLFGGAKSLYKLDDDQAVLYSAPNLSYPLYFEYFFNRSGLADGRHTLIVDMAGPDENLPQGQGAGSTLVFDYLRFTPSPSLDLSNQTISTTGSVASIITTNLNAPHATDGVLSTNNPHSTNAPLVSTSGVRRTDTGLIVGVVLACVGGILALVCGIMLLRRRRRAGSRIRGMDLLQDNSTYSTLGSEAAVTPYMESFPHTSVTYGAYLPSSNIVYPGTVPPSYTEHGSHTPREYISSSKTASFTGSSAARDTIVSLPPRVDDRASRSDEGSDVDSVPPPTYRTAPSAE